MSTPRSLDISFRCMCFFVPDKRDNCIHVLMPSTQMHVHADPDNGGGGHTHGGGRESSGSLHGDVHGDVAGVVGGDIHGNVYGDIRGTVRGSVYGSIFGDVLGSVLGHEHGHDCGTPIPTHVIRARTNQKPSRGIDLAGWALTLGEGGIDPDQLDLDDPEQPDVPKGEIADLTAVLREAGFGEARSRINRVLVSDAPGADVVSRITLRAGRLLRLKPQARWDILGRTDIAMASQVVWRIDDFPAKPQGLWTRLNPDGTAVQEPLLPIPPEGDLTIDVYHLTGSTFPFPGDDPDPIPAKEASLHFAAYYPSLFGIDAEARLLPVLRGPLVPGGGGDLAVTCSGGRGELGG